MKKNFLISTGGSGGHVIPAMIMYEHLCKENNVLITSDKRGLKYLDKNSFEHEIIDTPRLGNIFIASEFDFDFYFNSSVFNFIKKKTNTQFYNDRRLYVFTPFFCS